MCRPPPSTLPSGAASRLWCPAPSLMHERTLSEHDSKDLLRRYGVPIAGERLVRDPDAAATAAAALGFPVVLKLCGDALAHKSERGLVRLGLGDAAAVR